VKYGIMQARGQLHIVMNAVPIDVALKDTIFPDSLKQKLLLVNEIKGFAIKELGLKNSSNYTTVYNQNGKPLLIVLTASDAYQLKPYQWHFPVLGNVPYKGFFDFNIGKKEAKELKAKGYDVDLGEVSAWSTLGWFKDPILSGMLERSEGYLANVIIHEMTHATMYVKNDVDFNENLANFIGSKGAELFLAYKYGKESKEYMHYKTQNYDDSLFSDYMVEGCKRLDSLYSHLKSDSPKAEKDTLKHEVIRSILSGIKELNVIDTTLYYKISRKKTIPNNAWFLQFRRYNAKQNSFEKEFHSIYQDDFKKYLEHLKSIYPSV
jgi:predicted aminopeptidase